jgi:hypothetical protein
VTLATVRAVGALQQIWETWQPIFDSIDRIIIGLLARRAHIDANLFSPEMIRLRPRFFSGKFSADANVSFLIHAGTGPVCLVQYLRTRSPIKTGEPPSFWIDSTAGKTNEAGVFRLKSEPTK